MTDQVFDSVIIGGGAAGFFAAITCSHNTSKPRVLLLEKSLKLLTKVKISGGGRCNTTHYCFDPQELVKNYPRGGKELRGPFTRFQPKDTIDWFRQRGVTLKHESDGRMFPTTDQSQTIINCLMAAADKIDIRRGQGVEKITRSADEFTLHMKSGDQITTRNVLLATGGTPAGHRLAKNLGHTIVDPIPSLFTFNIPDSPLTPLAGISMDNVVVSLPQFRKKYRGPILITHWGFSGPAVLKLSAFCARDLHNHDYKTTCQIDWAPDLTTDNLRDLINKNRQSQLKQSIHNTPLIPLPKQLWKTLAEVSGIDTERRWTNLSKAQSETLINKIKQDNYNISGKTTYKQEFVTCGGVTLSEVNFNTMESKLVPGLYFAGEILDIDGITGGFNFQAAWTTGWLAGNAMGDANINSDI